MSWYRKVKSIYSISIVTISFIIWSTLSNWLFQNPVDYKLFLICTCVVFFTQYIHNVKFKKNLLIILPLGVSVIASAMFFEGQTIVLNTIFLLFIIFTTDFLEDAPIDYSKYKVDINKSMVALVFIWIISFTLGLDFVDKIYKFHILYIIMIIILMRETLRYVYDAKSKTSMITNIIIGISVLTLSLDYAGKIIKGLLDMIMNIVNYIILLILTILTYIFGGVMNWFLALFMKAKIIIEDRNVMISEPITNSESLIPGFSKKQLDEIIYNDKLKPTLDLVFKILILLIILYMIYRFLTRFSSKTKTYNGFTEEKEKIVKRNKKKHWGKDLFGKIFESGLSNRDKILYTYKGFEKITQRADIYEPYMTATQLENATKVNVNNIENLEEMTESYNEAKFSLHDITEDKVRLVKKGHKNIKRQL